MKTKVIFVLSGIALFIGITIFNNNVSVNQSIVNARLVEVNNDINDDGFRGKIVTENATYFIPDTTYNHVSFEAGRLYEVGSEEYRLHRDVLLNNYIQEFEDIFNRLSENGYTLDHQYLALFRTHTHLNIQYERHGIPTVLPDVLVVQPLFSRRDLKEQFIREIIFRDQSEEKVNEIIDSVLFIPPLPPIYSRTVNI